VTIDYEYAIAVPEAAIDHMGHVNNAVYLTWAQDAVIAHWLSLADAQVKAEHVWIARKHEIRYLKPAFFGQNLLVRLSLETARGASACYTTAITRGEEIIAEIKSTWCSVNPVTRRPRRLTRAIQSAFLGERFEAAS
jgi:acyl-CoA thioester hydrolase